MKKKQLGIERWWKKRIRYSLYINMVVGMPAILKGFIDRIFVAGFAYKYEGTLPKGLLKGKKAWVINTLDSPLWYVALLYRSADWIIMKRGVLRFAAFAI